MKFNLSISRNSKDEVGIEVRCKTSKKRFLTLNLTLEEYAQVITGLSQLEVNGEVKDLECVGKTKVMEGRSVVLNSHIYSYDKKVLVKYLEENCQEEGWILDSYLGSQNSIEYLPDNMYKVNYSVFKYL